MVTAGPDFADALFLLNFASAMKKIAIIGLSLLVSACTSAQVKEYVPKIIKEYPHKVSSYTQGLFFHDGTLYETTGQWGESSINTINIETGEPLLSKKLKNKYFGEGSSILGDNLYILTWTNKVAFVYDAATLTYRKTISYPREGWGLTTDGKQLIASDGSSTLYFMDENLKVTRRQNVTLLGRPLRNLNELEWINGKIWANVYLTDLVVIINPSNGKVEATLDCTGLLPMKLRSQTTDVLNGIAIDEKGQIYLTGKYWPRMYQIELVKKK